MATGDIKKRKLGRGLSALLGDDAAADYNELDRERGPKTLPVEYLQPGRYQPRQHMDEEQIAELAASIAEMGIIQPLLVRRLDDHENAPNAYEIVAGERRWRAAQRAKLHDVPVIIREMNDMQALEIGLVENLQRQDLSPLEEAEGYQRLMNEFSHNQEALAKVIGKSRSHVANTVRLLGLPDRLKKLIDQGKLSAGHGRALLSAKNPEELANKIINQGLNVRQTEKLVQREGQAKKSTSSTSTPTPPKDTDTLALERDVSELLGLKVDIIFKDGHGSLTIHYKDLGQLDDVLARLSHKSRANILAEDLDEVSITRDADADYE